MDEPVHPSLVEANEQNELKHEHVSSIDPTQNGTHKCTNGDDRHRAAGDCFQVALVHGDPTKPSSIFPPGKWDEEDSHSMANLKHALAHLEGYSFSILNNHDTLMDDLRSLKMQGKVDLVLQFCDEGWQNHHRMEMHVCALLEMFHINYTGSGAACIGTTLDKEIVLRTAESVGIPIPRTIYVASETHGIDLRGLKYPIIVKPNSTDGSFGITKKNVCRDEAELMEAIKDIRELFNVHCPLIIQEYLEGVDLNCVIIGNPPGPHTVLPITEEDFSALPAGWPKILGFESKWLEDSPYYQIKSVPTTLDKEKQDLIAEYSKRLFHRLGVRDYARFDWRLDNDGNPRLLELNANCGWGDSGHMAKTAAFAGISYPEMLKMIIEAARFRHTTRAKDNECKWADLHAIANR